MTTSPAIHRRPLHTRTITCSGFLRDDGLIDIEGEMQDITPTGTDLLFKRVPPGGAIHHMCVTMTIDRDMVIHDVVARLQAGPTQYCPEIESAYAGLKGLQIRGGFRQQVKAIVGGVNGCTHLTELLGPMATTAMQSTMAIMRAERDGRRPMDGEGPMPRPALIGTCHTYRMDSPVVEYLWPASRRQPADVTDIQPSSRSASADTAAHGLKHGQASSFCPRNAAAPDKTIQHDMEETS